jgi:hypothetical protein
MGLARQRGCWEREGEGFVAGQLGLGGVGGSMMAFVRSFSSFASPFQDSHPS